jgi:hypothetical protein
MAINSSSYTFFVNVAKDAFGRFSRRYTWSDCRWRLVACMMLYLAGPELAASSHNAPRRVVDNSIEWLD